MTLGSLFDGSGTALLAATMCGIVPVWAAEIEPYPIAVTHTHFPDVIHLGDVTRIDGGKIPPVDVVVFGSPCQDMSVAGKRAGMQHTEHGDDETTRSGLFYEAVRIIREMRGATNGVYPAFAVWENVPGAFSSNDGEDFRCVLEELANISGGGLAIPRPAGGAWKSAGLCMGDTFSIAWRVLDAQYWGVPQRRRRIFLVADFRSERAGKVLFERDGLKGYIAQGGKAQKGAAVDAGCSLAGGNRIFSIHDKATRYRGGGSSRHGDGAGNGLGISDDGTMYTLDTGCRHALAFMAGQGAKAGSVAASEEYSPTLRAAASGTNQVPSVVYPQVFHTLTALNARCTESARQANCVVCMAHGQEHAEIYEDKAPNLTCKHEQPIVFTQNQRGEVRDLHDKSGALAASPGIKQQTYICGHETTKSAYIVRRLTPNECCRLQGFPDGWGKVKHIDSLTNEESKFWNDVRETALRVAGKTAKPLRNDGLMRWVNGLHTDSAEYKMWGNGMALPCLLYVIEGIQEHGEEKEK